MVLYPETVSDEQIRAWHQSKGFKASDRGPVTGLERDRYNKAHKLGKYAPAAS